MAVFILNLIWLGCTIYFVHAFIDKLFSKQMNMRAKALQVVLNLQKSRGAKRIKLFLGIFVVAGLIIEITMGHRELIIKSAIVLVLYTIVLTTALFTITSLSNLANSEK